MIFQVIHVQASVTANSRLNREEHTQVLSARQRHRTCAFYWKQNKLFMLVGDGASGTLTGTPMEKWQFVLPVRQTGFPQGRPVLEVVTV